MIFISEILYHWKKDSDYAIMAKRWTKAFAILLGVAIPTGTIVGVQISLLWPGFAKIVGQVISVPFQIEIFAFFLEALFMSIYVYAADKLPPFMRLISLFFVMLGATASAVLITSANTWMNTPAGFSMNPDGSVLTLIRGKLSLIQVLAQVHFMSLLRLMQPVQLSLLLLLDLNY